MTSCKVVAPIRVCCQVNMDVEAKLVQDMLKGDDCFEIRLRLKQHKDEQFPYKDDE